MSINNGIQQAGLELEQRNFNFKQFIGKYLKYWYFFGISLMIAIGIAKYYNWYATPLYRSSCRIIIKDENYGSGAENVLKDLGNLKRNRNLENEIQMIRSKSMVSKAVKNLENSVTYILQGKLKSTQLYKKSPFYIETDTLMELAYFSGLDVNVISKDQFELSIVNNMTKKSGPIITYNFNQTIVTDIGTFRLKHRKGFDSTLFDDENYTKRNFKCFFNSLENIAHYFAGQLSVEIAASGSSILELTVVDVVPEQCSDFLNALTDVYVKNSIEQKNLLASNSLKFIDSQLEQISEELKEIESVMMEFKKKKGVIDMDEESKIFLSNVKDYDEKISELNAKIDFVKYLEKYIVDNKKINDVTPTSFGINDQVLVKLINNLSDLEQERDKRQYDSKVTSPIFENLDLQIRRAKTALLENLGTIKQKLLIEQKEARDQLDLVEGKIKDIPKTEIELIGIRRQFTIKEGMYLYLLQKKSETSILLASAVSDNIVIDKAATNFQPFKPVKSKSYAIAIVLALLLPTLIIFIIELLNDKITDKEMLSDLTKIPLIGVVGLNENNASMFTENKPKNQILEAFRAIRTNINYFLDNSNHQNKHNTILITSSISTEGKTFCSFNLSAILALSEKKTILVCLDMRKPKMVEGIDLNVQKGVSNYLSGSLELKDVIQASNVPYLDILLSGPIPPNPSELLLKERVSQMFELLKKDYDYVVIDTPPIGLVADAMTLMKFSDLNLYVVRQNVTQKQHIQHINKLYNESKVINIGLVFNAVTADKSGYGYGYGYGYGQDIEENPSILKRIFKRKTT